MKTDSSSIDSLIETLIVRSDAEQLMDRLDEAISGLFQAKMSFEDQLAEVCSPKQKKIILEVIEAKGLKLTNLTEVEQLLREIKETIAKIPVLELTLAIDPTEKLLSRVQDWVAENVNMKVLIDTKTNPKLIGGIMISINGYYHDYSLSKLLKAM